MGYLIGLVSDNNSYIGRGTAGALYSGLTTNPADLQQFDTAADAQNALREYARRRNFAIAKLYIAEFYAAVRVAVVGLPPTVYTVRYRHETNGEVWDYAGDAAPEFSRMMAIKPCTVVRCARTYAAAETMLQTIRNRNTNPARYSIVAVDTATAAVIPVSDVPSERGLACGCVSQESHDDRYTCYRCGDGSGHCVDSVCEDCEGCTNACNCFRCSGCDTMRRNRCGDCRNCSDCCSCYSCSECGSSTRDSGCSGCSRCEDCCNCRSVNGYAEEDSDAGAPWIADKAHRKGFDCARLVGVELEYNEVNGSIRHLAEWSEEWRAGNHYDGSCGREVVTAPLSGDYIKACLTELGDAFEASRASADERCGIHVHVDAKDLQWSDMYRLLCVYEKIEPILYMIAGQERTRNRYCKPVGKQYGTAVKATDRKGAVMNVAYQQGDEKAAKQYVRNYKPGKKDGGRYRGLNLCPWLAGRRETSKGGKPKADTTVEFRIHRGSLDGTKVANWAMLLARIVDWTSKASNQDVQDLPKSGLRALCTVIAPDMRAFILDSLREWRRKTTAQPEATPGHMRKSTILRNMTNKDGNWQIVQRAS